MGVMTRHLRSLPDPDDSWCPTCGGLAARCPDQDHGKPRHATQLSDGQHELATDAVQATVRDLYDREELGLAPDLVAELVTLAGTACFAATEQLPAVLGVVQSALEDAVGWAVDTAGGQT